MGEYWVGGGSGREGFSVWGGEVVTADLEKLGWVSELKRTGNEKGGGGVIDRWGRGVDQ